MATSASYLWSPDLAEAMDEAFERAKVDPATLDPRKIESAKRSVNYMLVGWAAKDYHEFRTEQISVPLVVGQTSYNLTDAPNTRAIDVLRVLHRDSSGYDTAMFPMTRDDYFQIPVKTTEGSRPSEYFADKQRDNIVLYIWPTSDNATDTLRVDVMRRFQDVGRGFNEQDIPYYMREAFVAGLAARLAQKFAPVDLWKTLRADGDLQFDLATAAEDEGGDVVIRPGRGRRR